MASFNSWNGEKLHGHKYLLTDVLKGRLGFTGFVVGDWNGHRQIPGCTVTRCAKAINAGLDMFMVPKDWKELYANTVLDVQSGAITMSRLDDAVRRILRVKFHAGLFDAGPVKNRAQIAQASLVGSQPHRAVAREAVRKSLVLLKNNQRILPINPKSNVLVSGSAANDIGQQAGGWTLTWQGTGNTNKDFPGASSIYDGIDEQVSEQGGQAILRENGEWSPADFANGARPDVAIVVIGEEPYAEWHGDIANIEYQYGSKDDLALLQKLGKSGIPVVTVFVSGRPLWVNRELNASTAFVAAWLPGSEGGGIADVLFSNANGDPKYDFQGRLSFSWPKRVSQATLNMGQLDYDPLFAYGYGLSYSNHQELTNALNESSVRQKDDPLGEQWVFVSRANSPWSIELREMGAEPLVVNGNYASTNNKAITLSSVDKVSQEDARRIAWSSTGSIALTTKMPLDFSDFEEVGGVLEFEVKMNQAPSDTLALHMKCATNCTGSVGLNDYASSPQSRHWSKVSAKLSCFTASDGSLDSVQDVFNIKSSGAADLSIANIKIVQAGQSQNVTRLPCSSAG